MPILLEPRNKCRKLAGLCWGNRVDVKRQLGNPDAGRQLLRLEFSTGVPTHNDMIIMCMRVATTKFTIAINCSGEWNSPSTDV